MNQTGEIQELIEYAIKALRDDGRTEDYIVQLSYTWNALTQYLQRTSSQFSAEAGANFLKHNYGIETEVQHQKFRCINKRRKRAINILVNCLEHSAATVPKTYLPYKFSPNYEHEFMNLLEQRRTSNLAISTVNRDIRCLNKLSEYLESSGVTALRELNSSYILGFMKWLSTSGQLPTLKGSASTLRILLKYLHQESILIEDISQCVPQVKVRTDEIPSVYTVYEIQEMLSKMNLASTMGKRDYAMVLLAARLGMRASDICGLLFENLNWQNNTIEYVTKKTGTFTQLPLTNEIGNAIIDYLRSGRPDTKDKHVFVRFDRPFQQLSPSVLHHIVTNAMREANIVILPGKRHGPHALRASLASEMLKQNTPLPVISEALTHTCTDTTRIYLKVDLNHLREYALDVPPLGNVWMGGVW